MFTSTHSRRARLPVAAALVGMLVAGGVPRAAAAQEPPARRLSSIVGVAVEEYAKGIDARGRLISPQEYQEAIDFLADATQVADRMAGTRAAQAREALDSLIAAMRARRPPADVAALHRRFAAALGAEGAGRQTTLLIGNGHMPDRGAVALGALRENAALRAVFRRRYLGAA
jgi:hypothetical protein